MNHAGSFSLATKADLSKWSFQCLTSRHQEQKPFAHYCHPILTHNSFSVLLESVKLLCCTVADFIKVSIHIHPLTVIISSYCASTTLDTADSLFPPTMHIPLPLCSPTLGIITMQRRYNILIFSFFSLTVLSLKFM